MSNLFMRNLVIVTCLLQTVLTTDVEFSERLNDRVRNDIVEGILEQGDSNLTYIPQKWPYIKGSNTPEADTPRTTTPEADTPDTTTPEAEEPSTNTTTTTPGAEDDEPPADIAEADSAASTSDQKWTHRVNIPYTVDKLSDREQVFINRIADDFREDTCINFFNATDEVPEEKQVIEFVMEEIGCDETIGMKPVDLERPQIQAMHADCLDAILPQRTSHYFMHLLGFDNEHQRPDNHEHITVKSDDAIANVKVAGRSNRKGHNMTLEDSVSFANGDWDSESIMLWSSKYLGPVDGENVAHMASDKKRTLSPGDIGKVNNYYECEKLERESSRDPVDTSEPDSEPEEECVYHIKEDTDDEMKVERKCFKDFAKVNTWPKKDMKITFTIDYDIEEAQLEDMNGRLLAGDEETTTEPEETTTSTAPDGEETTTSTAPEETTTSTAPEEEETTSAAPSSNEVSADDLAAFRTAIKDKLHSTDAIKGVEECVRAHIQIAAGGDINTATEEFCGTGKKEIVGECGRGVKADYTLEQSEWLSKSATAKMNVKVKYEECNAAEDEAALATELGFSNSSKTAYTTYLLIGSVLLQ